jgi:polysaccharide biosynthesis/export protein
LSGVDDSAEFDLLDLISVLRARWLLIAGFVLAISAAAIAYALLARPVYRSTLVMISASAERSSLGGALASTLGSLGGLGSLAGLNIGNDAAVEEALAVLRSRRFGESFINDLDLMPRFFASEWDAEHQKLRLQSGLDRPTELVRVEGRVKVPGEYPLEPGVTLSALLRAGGILDASAFGGKAELARFEVGGDATRQTELLEIDLASVLRGDPTAGVALRPFDYLLIKETPKWTDQESVTLRGEVKVPGMYPIRRGETLHQVIDRAGGLTAYSFPQDSAFTRVKLREREQRQLDMLRDRLPSDLASMALQTAAVNQAGASQALGSSGDSLLDQIQTAQAVGRLVIDLPGLLEAEAGSAKDIVMRNGALLVVPKIKQEVTVIGEVQSSTSHLYTVSLRTDDYIALSGGTTRRADSGRTYVVRAEGSVVAKGGSMFRRSKGAAIQPAHTIVVPFDAERRPPLPFWTSVTQILYNLAISVAAINSF